ncbi:glycosyltransferase family 4 protein [Xanthocytophaga agilis]|uniref:Glycosyltransferase family 4 protein n=1 Tax=Xanthocytophaga agilis TaxID=3048010 RepID=A0AAE3UFR7_9BACT|nr:glycosyltransferase family 4 protein [Xanthocytophaga agilis]MDJ1504148.1 glycosyltransferase family 4 protein [Xanthocytophaga agilis]
MNVTLINTYQSSGGAAVACRRLALALRKSYTNATLLVQEQAFAEDFVTPVATSYLQKKAVFGRFIAERLYFYFFERSKQVRFAFSPGVAGIDISIHPAILQADVLHLHWIHFGFLSLESLKRLLSLNKPIVWTLHDMWAMTGGCHYSGTCAHYLSHCHECPFLKYPSEKDLSYRVFEKKKALLQNAPIHFVTCSQWLADKARQSALLRQFPVIAIPNPIDTELYKPMDVLALREKLGLPLDKKLLLFGAMNTQDPRKGFAYLEKALNQLYEADKNLKEQIELVIFGKAEEEILRRLPFYVHDYGSVKGDTALVELYNVCDAMVLPSLEDNLPNTVMEALSCGTPVVAFDTGGLPEMIDHMNSGYLALYQSAEDLSKGILFVLEEQRKISLQEHARKSVLERFTEERIAGRYQSLYHSLIHKEK